MKKTLLQSLHCPERRLPILAEMRRAKMSKSAHGYVRGSARLFYQWLSEQAPGTLPEGPAVWICGDCHLGNLGPVADVDGHVAVQIRDLDQSVVGNPVHDLLRLSLSLATAARSADLPGVMVSRMTGALIAGYLQAFDDAQSDRIKDAQRPAVVKTAMSQALNRSWQKLDRKTIDGIKPRIPLGKRFWPLSATEHKAIRALFESETGAAVRKALGRRPAEDSRIEVLDAAFWVKGCSSLGRRRYAVLLDMGETCRNRSPHCILDIKEAVDPVSGPERSFVMPSDNAARVVEGARRVSPLLGNRMCAAHLNGCSVVIRELRPQDLKLDADRLTEADAEKSARFLALVVGQAHAHQMDAQTRRGWLTDLQGRQSRSADAPSWLWQNTVQLMVAHEAEYLDHCRRCSAGGEVRRTERQEDRAA